MAARGLLYGGAPDSSTLLNSFKRDCRSAIVFPPSVESRFHHTERFAPARWSLVADDQIMNGLPLVVLLGARLRHDCLDDADTTFQQVAPEIHRHRSSHSKAARCFSMNASSVMGGRPPSFSTRSFVPAKMPFWWSIATSLRCWNRKEFSRPAFFPLAWRTRLNSSKSTCLYWTSLPRTRPRTRAVSSYVYSTGPKRG